MSDIFDFSTEVPRFAVMGNPVAHSKSPLVHSEFGKQTGIALEYTAIQVDLGGFNQAVDGFRAGGGRGLNVTVPFKGEAWSYADEKTAYAEVAGAVNTLVFDNSAPVSGDNTDGRGLVRDIQENLGVAIAGRRVLIVGAGGATRGVVKPIADENPESVVITNRTADKAVTIAKELSSHSNVSIEGCGLNDVHKRNFDLVINATSASIGGDVPDVGGDCVKGAELVYDMMYGTEATSFMKFADSHGASRSADGLGMLVEQAAFSFQRWLGVFPETGPVISLLRS